MTPEELRTAGLLGLLALAALLAGAFALLRHRRFERALREPFPEHWRALLEGACPLYRRMPEQVRRGLEPHARALLMRVGFIGCAGLRVTDTMRLMVAIQAALLVGRLRPAATYASLYSVMLYPDEFVVEESEVDEAGVVTEGSRALSGQTVEDARILLSWRDMRAASRPGEAYNVVLHEFCHYLDHRGDGAPGAPGAPGAAGAAGGTLEAEYQRLCEALERDEDTLIDPYGAEDPAEFLAVATETFFELGAELEEFHPELYALLRDRYGHDPARWPPAP